MRHGGGGFQKGRSSLALNSKTPNYSRIDGRYVGVYRDREAGREGFRPIFCSSGNMPTCYLVSTHRSFMELWKLSPSLPAVPCSIFGVLPHMCYCQDSVYEGAIEGGHRGPSVFSP